MKQHAQEHLRAALVVAADLEVFLVGLGAWAVDLGAVKAEGGKASDTPQGGQMRPHLPPQGPADQGHQPRGTAHQRVHEAGEGFPRTLARTIHRHHRGTGAGEAVEQRGPADVGQQQRRGHQEPVGPAPHADQGQPPRRQIRGDGLPQLNQVRFRVVP